MKITVTVAGIETPVGIETANRVSLVMAAVMKEREFQTGKYGTVIAPTMDIEAGFNRIDGWTGGPGGHELGAWLVILESELDEAKKALVHGGSKSVKGRDTIRAELVQIAAVAIAALEQHGVEE